MLKINIWSDVRCPFCYIGKRKFESALDNFAHRDRVEVVWRSFQLDPGLKTQPDLHVYDYLARVKGISREETVRMHEYVKSAAEQVGLVFDFDRGVVANSFNAHRLIQMGKKAGLGNEIDEALFKAHFTDGKNIDDQETLVSIGVSIGLTEHEVREVIAGNKFADEVRQDEMLARSLGIRAVPFFLMNDHLGVSGAQDPRLFYQALQRAWNEFEAASRLA